MKNIICCILVCVSAIAYGQGLSRKSLDVLAKYDSIKENKRDLKANRFASNQEELEKNERNISKVNANNWFKVKYFTIYAGGALQSMVSGNSQDSSGNATSTTGNIGFNIITSKLSCDIYYSYNCKEEIDMNSLGKFGSSLMNPNLSGQSFSFSALASVARNLGIYGSCQVANNIWKTDSVTSISAAPIIVRLGLCWNPFDFSSVSNKLAFTINANLTHRSVLGDFNNGDQVIDGYTIQPRGYNGFDISANFYLNDLRFIFQYSQNLDGKLARTDASSLTIPGFTGGQVNLAIVVNGNIISDIF